MNRTLPTLGPGQRKVLVFGPKYFFDYGLLKDRVSFYTAKFADMLIVTGGYQHYNPYLKRWTGADYWAEWYAYKEHYAWYTFQAEWWRFGGNRAKAERERNPEMVSYVGRDGYAIGFHDGECLDTLALIQLCRQYRVKLKVVEFDREKQRLPRWP